MDSFPRPAIRRCFTGLMAIALPFSAIGCGDNSEALLPLSAACDGGGVPGAADFDATAAEKPAVAIAQNGSLLTVRNEYLGSDLKVAGNIAAAQVVVCVDPGTPSKEETCRYTGASASTIERQKRTADVKLVAAKTGQVLGGETLSAVARPCPEKIAFRQDSEPEDQVYDADAELTTVIAEWVPGAIATAQPINSASDTAPVTSAPGISIEASANAGDLTAQCEALDAATDTDFGNGFGAQLTAQNVSTNVMKKDDTTVIVAVRSGVENMEEELQEIQGAIQTLRDAPLAEPELLEFRNQFLAGLTVMQTNMQRFQKLLQEAQPHAGPGRVTHGNLAPIAGGMPPLATALTQQQQALEKIRTELFTRCLQLKRT